MRTTAIALLRVLVAIVGLALPARALAQEVVATVETDPVPNSGDAADDPALWIHPGDAALSTIIGTDKKGGLAVYDLDGSEIQYLADGQMNNVDIRYGFELDGDAVALVTAGNESTGGIATYRVDPDTRQLVDVAAGVLDIGIEIYGSCMYRSARTGEVYFIGNAKSGEVAQLRLADDGTGHVGAELVRSFDVGGQTEGCVADDELGFLYIGEETVGIWKYGAEPEDGDARTSVDTAGGGHLEADVEGLSIYYASDGTGYLLASSQGDDTFAVYRREGDNAYVTSFAIAAGDGIDEVTGTDGIDVSNVALGPAFPEGVFIAQDGTNEGTQNFKLVPWGAVAASASPPLTIDTAYDPTGADGGSGSGGAGGGASNGAGGAAASAGAGGEAGPGGAGPGAGGTGASGDGDGHADPGDDGGCASARGSRSNRGATMLLGLATALVLAARRRSRAGCGRKA
jgi:3-phytase